MSKGNLFLGQARGKVGDVVFYRLDGAQVTRSRNRSPKNPKTPIQLAQRVIMNTVSKAYSLLYPISDHAFEGLSEGAMNQRRFLKDNTDLLRMKCAEVFADPENWASPAGQVFNFNPKSYVFPVLNDYIISRGTIASTTTISFNPVPCLVFNSALSAADCTYAELVTALGLQRGDQLTFVCATHDGRFGYGYKSELNGLRYARIILEPASGDMTLKFMLNGAVNDPNPKNEGNISLEIGNYTLGEEWSGWGMKYRFPDVSEETTAAVNYGGTAVIVSRWDGMKWLRSTQQLVPSFTGSYAEESDTLLLAIESYQTEQNSALYLNQSENRGVDNEGATVLSVQFFHVNCPKGSVFQTNSTTRAFDVSGYGLDDTTVQLTKDGAAQVLSFTGTEFLHALCDAAGVWVLTINGEMWAQVTVTA